MRILTKFEELIPTDYFTFKLDGTAIIAQNVYTDKWLLIANYKNDKESKKAFKRLVEAIRDSELKSTFASDRRKDEQFEKSKHDLIIYEM